MPIYAYRCSECGFQEDFLQKISDPVLTDCPQCGKPTLNKQLTAAGFQLKGSGWYATDFKGGNSSPAGKTSAGNSDDAGKSATVEPSKSDKPAESAAGHSCGTGACATCT